MFSIFFAKRKFWMMTSSLVEKWRHNPDWWRHNQKELRKCYEQRISITCNESRRYKTMTTNFSYLYNQIFLVFIHPKITCQLAMINDWELLIKGSKLAQIFRKHVKINLVPWKIRAGHRPTSIFHNKKNAADGAKLPHPIRNTWAWGA